MGGNAKSAEQGLELKSLLPSLARTAAMVVFIALLWVALIRTNSAFYLPELSFLPDLVFTTMAAIAGFCGILRMRAPFEPE
jgi:hypothetical protein